MWSLMKFVSPFYVNRRIRNILNSFFFPVCPVSLFVIFRQLTTHTTAMGRRMQLCADFSFKGKENKGTAEATDEID